MIETNNRLAREETATHTPELDVDQGVSTPAPRFSQADRESLDRSGLRIGPAPTPIDPSELSAASARVNTVSAPPLTPHPDAFLGASQPLAMLSAAAAEDAPAAAGLVSPAENTDRALSEPHETPTTDAGCLVLPKEWQVAEASRRQALVESFEKLTALGLSKAEAAAQLQEDYTTLWRYRTAFQASGFAGLLPANDKAGRKPGYVPTAYELAAVRAVYLKLDESEARGRGLGSSRVAAFRIVAKSQDEQISATFRATVLRRQSRTLPPTWLKLLQTPASVIDAIRDTRSTNAAYITTPRGRSYVDATGQERPLRAGTIFEADDGTFNFYAWIPWPFGGDKCSDKFGVKLGRWQLLAVVDARWEFCPHYHVVARNLSSYRGEDAMALLGDTMFSEGRPEVWRLERGSWESNIVRDALALSGAQVVHAWHSKQKSAVERFFDRLWTPLALMPGHAGRDRDRFHQLTQHALACQDGRRDPREDFLSLDSALPRVEAAVQFVNGEPIESRTWGRWIPQERYAAQLGEQPLPQLDPSLRIFFAREQRVWTVRGCCVGGNVDGPLVKFPVWFQTPELWEFEGCRVKCFFDPYTPEVRATLVLVDAWRSYPAGHVIARDVLALELPPQAVLAEGWSDDDRVRTLAIRKAISKAVRTEARNWSGTRTSEARDGMGNSVRIDSPQRRGDAEKTISEPQRLSVSAVQRSSPLAPPTAEQVQDRRSRLAARAQRARALTDFAEV